jgi:phosphoglucosamine mutase
MGRLFGTDGVRGVAGRDLTAQLAMDLAVAAAGILGRTGAFTGANSVHDRPLAVVGRDPRTSGEFLEAAVVAGLAGSGVDVLRLGVIPTPAVAYLTAALGAEFGVMLSASHNPAPDNGIKFFARGGVKLPDDVEDQIEAQLAQAQLAQAPDGRGGRDSGGRRAGDTGIPAAGFGRVTEASGEGEIYLDYLLSTLDGLSPGTGAAGSAAFAGGAGAGDGAGAASAAGPDSAQAAGPLSGMLVVVDCAHGAAYQLAPRMLRRAGAEVIAIGVEPDGDNINAGCGSTSLGALSAAVIKHGADAGIAHDGDADRCLAVDADGQVIDGDQILAVLALALRDAGRLTGDTVVTTVMSNLGFRLAMRDAGIRVVETPVGDRYLVAAMRAGQYTLGGEQSGHIILLDHATTGDGLLTALHLLAVAASRGKSLAELVSVMTRYPQVLINIPGVDKSLVGSSHALTAAVRAAEAELGDSGRVLVRPSGTEHAVRVMVEAVDPGQARRLAGQLADAVRGLG